MQGAARQWVLRVQTKQLPFDHGHLVPPRHTQTLHGQVQHFQASGFGGVGSTNVRTTVAVRDRCCLSGPLTCQGFDGVGWYTTKWCCPLGCLGDTVFFAQHVIFEGVEAVGVSVYIFFLKGTFSDPGVGNRKVDGCIGIGLDRDPLVGMYGCSIVNLRADEDLLDAQLSEEVQETARHLALPTPGCRFWICAPEE